MKKIVHIYFENPEYNYATQVNPLCSDAEISDYFRVGTTLNMGNVTDDMQTIKAIKIEHIKI